MSGAMIPTARLVALGLLLGAGCTLVNEDNQYGFAGYGEPYHPKGYAKAANHGPESNLRVEDCRLCHGKKLTGGVSRVSCDKCHADGWREDCVYCHGGERGDIDGAPGRDIDGTSDPDLLTFPPHQEHTAGADHAALACTECHQQPDNVLSPHHNFVDDDTVAVAEVDFSTGLSPDVAWRGDSCGTVYCHGTGLEPKKKVKLSRTDLPCDGCHAMDTSTLDKQLTMSFGHLEHLRHNVACSECHAATVDASNTIIGPAKHVNGKSNVVITEPVTWSNKRCTGACHNENHNNDPW